MSISSLDAKIDNKQDAAASPQLGEDGKFRNTRQLQQISFKKMLGLIKRMFFEKKHNTIPTQEIPVQALTRSLIAGLPDDQTSLVRLGHSSILVKIAGQTWLIDPVFSERASPVNFFGPKRFHAPPIELKNMPPVDGVIISHNHYDHMDKQSVKALNDRVPNFVVPLGNAAQLETWGVEASKITELDWWQSAEFDGLKLIATPAQHFSGRGLGDRDRCLWASWVLESDQSKLFFSGDSGYFDGFKLIGERHGPFDLTMIETGAYDEQWADVHMSPTESAKAHLDLRGRKMLPIHNGTFDLAFHEWSDPFEQMVNIADKEWIDLMTPEMGQILTLGDEASVERSRDLFWWRL